MFFTGKASGENEGKDLKCCVPERMCGNTGSSFAGFTLFTRQFYYTAIATGCCK
ncbi:hypothetical protein H6G74_28340 [Nostoc spongiaeforme FACHB-130]|uniref:Uncharacterized protein n=1 Tax=Nostoc spongiaeforme FACHB-130 TaxID=1357510 RepID=A0ABR8G4K6_9NOSO|nr:hypothetical protein [Nostoc spongiaeforme]MBD2598204.1 hypothetical protein [Nostoc spongiaeforme FACHB-130]